MKTTLLAVALICAAVTAHAQGCSDPLIKNADDAGKIAFTMWHIVNPHFSAIDEQKWISLFDVSLNECVWEIALKPEPPRDYSTFVIRIGAKDGRFLGAQISD